ncbi:MAG: hypothetical protein ABEI78_02100, partial [Candidatus Nanohaloarchaea archaeon]
KSKLGLVNEVERLVVTTRSFSVSEFSSQQEEYVEEEIRSKEKILTEEDSIDLGDDSGTLKVLDIYPEKGVIGENTNIEFKDEVYYKKGDEEFKVDEDRVYRVGDFSNLEEDVKIKDPKSFANVLSDNPDSKVYVTDDGEKWLCEGNFFSFNED